MIRRYDLVLMGGKTVELIIDTDKKQFVLGDATCELQQLVNEVIDRGHVQMRIGWEVEGTMVDGLQDVEFTSPGLAVALQDELLTAGVIKVVEK